MIEKRNKKFSGFSKKDSMGYKKIIFKSVTIMGSATFVSRILGFIRDMVIARFLGASLFADAFFVAFRIPNFLRRLFGEGSLTASFIPVFTKYKIEHGDKGANELSSISFTLLTIVVTFVTVLGIIFSPLIVTIFAPGFEKDVQKFLITVKLNRIMFPYILFISLVALSMGILNSLKHFFAPAIAPALLNVSMIAGAVLFYYLCKNVVYGLAIGVVIGGILQLLLQFVYLKKFKIRIRPNFHFSNYAIKDITLLMGPSLLGLAITQINILINTLLASFLPTGSISYLYYADRLIQFPLGIFAVSVGSAVLPVLSEQSAKNHVNDMESTFIFGIKLILLISIPAATGLIFAGKPIISFLFQRGEFSMETLNNVYSALIGYSFGLWAYAGIRVIVPVYYAFKDTKTPVKIGAAALVINVVVSVLLMKIFLHTGLAVATAVSSSFNFIALFFMLKKHIVIKKEAIFKYLLKLIIPTLILILSIKSFLTLFPFAYKWNFAVKFGYILLIVAFSTVIYAFSCYIAGVEEIKTLRKLFKK